MSTQESPSARPKQYRLPGIEREGVAQLSFLETALWPLNYSVRSRQEFRTEYGYTTVEGRKTAHVVMRAPLGLRPFDELVLWGLLGATVGRQPASPTLLATPYWMLKHLGLDTGGSRYAELRESLLRIAVASYQNDGFYNPESKEREMAALQFLSVLFPTVGGVGERVDDARCWKIEWNAPFFRFCRASGGTLLFDLEVYRQLSPGARRLFLKLKDRFWRSKRVFINVDDLTINGMGFASHRPLAKRKYDLMGCLRELIDHRIVALGKGQHDAKDMIFKRGKGQYVVSFFEGEYFRKPSTSRHGPKTIAVEDDPLHEPLRRIGVDAPAIKRLLRTQSRRRIQQWIRLTDAAMHEQPRGFAGFRVSPAAFLIDGVQKLRTPPDWAYAHEKELERKQWERQRQKVDQEAQEHRQQYDCERAAAWQAFRNQAEVRAKFDQTYTSLIVLHRVTDPDRTHEAAQAAAWERVERLDFRFPTFDEWLSTNVEGRVH